jgi:diguanylate cyclase (GGDEF)-like protein
MKTSNNIRNMRRGLTALAIVFPGLYLLFAIAAITRDYQATLERAESDVRKISVSLNEHAMRTIGEADSRLQGAIAEIERRGLSMPGPDEVEIHDVLKWYSRQLPQAVSLSASDAQGQIRVNSLAYPMQPIDARDRLNYQYHLANPSPDLLISRPGKSRVTGKWTIPLSRRISNPDGSLRMFIVVGIDLEYFNSFYRTLSMGEKSRLVLVRPDGWMLMETPLTEKVMSMNIADSALFRHLKQSPAGTFRNESGVFDGTARIVGYVSSSQYPLIAAASLSQEDVLASWRTEIRKLGIIGGVSFALILGLIILLWKRLNDLTATQTSLARQNDDLVTSRQRYQELVDGIDAIVWEAELPNFHFTYVSGNAAAISGYPAEVWLSNPDFWKKKLSNVPDGQNTEAVLAINSHTTVLQPIEHHVFAPDGREIWLRSNIMVAAATKGAIRLRGVMVDITGQKNSEKQLFQTLHFDRLTKLPNRHTLEDRVEHALVVAARGNTWGAVMLIDMDHFKTINDSLGHEKGDQVLCAVTQRLQACLGATDTVARIGGDEFVVLLEDADSSLVEVEQLAERITESVGQSIAVDGHELHVEISMGITLFPQDGKDFQTLMRNADTALYRAKAAGRNCWRFFDESMARHATQRLEIETALRRAIERNEFLLHFQPQCLLKSGRIIGVEALLRWARPGVGIVPPLDFLPLAEESGLIVPIGAWVLQSACKQAVAWSNEHRLPLRMSVNVAAKQIHHKDFVEQVRATLAETGLPPHLLELEITESSIIESIDESIAKLHQIKALGVAVAVDDFGTGYSSLSYLKELPIDRLKIDQTFVRDIPINPDDCAIVRTIIAMARNLGLSVIAEGVETQDQLDFLRAEGCDEIQGYFLSRPVSADALLIHCQEAVPLM